MIFSYVSWAPRFVKETEYLDNKKSVMGYVARLREKMNENARKPKFVKTVWGVGYTIE